MDLTINNTQIDHIWTNATTQQCNIGSTQTYWTYHNLVYFVFKLLNFIPQFIIPSINEQTLNKKIIQSK